MNDLLSPVPTVVIHIDDESGQMPPPLSAAQAGAVDRYPPSSGAPESSARDAHLKSLSPGSPTRDLSGIVLDMEFRDLVPPPTPEEQARMRDDLFRDETPTPLVVWRCRGHRILLIGYELFDTIKLYGLSVVVEERELETREHARIFVIQRRLARPNLSGLEITYLLGVCYHDEKQEPGGDRRSQQARSLGRGKTAEALAEIFHQLSGTIRRAGAVAAAVKKIAALYGRDLMPLLFSRKARFSAQGVLDLAAVEPVRLQTLIGQLRLDGKLPRSWRGNNDAATLDTITLPREPHAMVRAILRDLGRDWLSGLAPVIQDVLLEHANVEKIAPKGKGE